jgi:PAS domain S-box-containing protein
MKEPKMLDIRVREQVALQAFEASPDAMVVINPSGEVVLFNYASELMFGYARSEVLGQQLEILLPAEAAEAHIKHRERYFVEPRVREMGNGGKLLGKHFDETLFPVQIKISPLVVSGSGVFGLAVVRRLEEP